MIDKLPSLARLIQQLQQMPYLASKNLYRFTNHVLNMDESRVKLLCDTILAAKQRIMPCPTCYAWQEKDKPCLFCGSPKRDQNLVCVVQTWQDLMAIEQTSGYHGVYHVLGGVIYPLEGVGPEDLTIEPLVTRVQGSTITEIILATNQTPEGEATAAYIARKLKPTGVKVSCLARGVPVGSSLEYMDRLTVMKALSERRIF